MRKLYDFQLTACKVSDIACNVSDIVCNVSCTMCNINLYCVMCNVYCHMQCIKLCVMYNTKHALPNVEFLCYDYTLASVRKCYELYDYIRV